MLGEIYHAVQKWFVGQLSTMVLIGVLTAIALSIIGIPYVLVLASSLGRVDLKEGRIGPAHRELTGMLPRQRIRSVYVTP